MIAHPRFTIETLKKLNIPLPGGHVSLSSIEHPLMKQAIHLRFGVGEAGLERIKCIDDNVFYKCKPNAPIRGAIWIDSVEKDCAWWLVDAGKREDDSRDDFYNQMEISCTNKLKLKRNIVSNFNLGKTTYSDHLLPSFDDYQRIKEEENYEIFSIIRTELIRFFERSCVNLEMWIESYFYDCPVAVNTTIEDGYYVTYLALGFTKESANSDKALKLASVFSEAIKPDDIECIAPENEIYPATDYIWYFSLKKALI